MNTKADRGLHRTGKMLATAVTTVAWLAAVAAAQSYDFAGYSWDQQDTPDVAVPLGPGLVQSAAFTNHPSSTANVTGFPNDASGFDSAVTPGRLLGLSGTGSRAVNLPSGNDGSMARSGFQLSWSGGRRLANQTGADFVVYESASTSTSPEGFMVQVRNADSQVWSRWYYEVASAHALYVGETSEGAFATAFDLDFWGVGAFDEIDAIRVANLTDEDRIDPPGLEISPGIFVGSGYVRPEDVGNTSEVVADPGPLANFQVYGASTLDPDILYVAALNPPNICGDGVTREEETCDDGNTDNLDGCSSTCQIEAPQSRPQRNCLKVLNTGGARVAATQGKASLGCLIAASRGGSPDAQACLTADAFGRIAKARAKTAKGYARACLSLPTFGETDVETINDAAEVESAALTNDVFGDDFGAAVIDEASDVQGATCQAAVLKAYEQLAAVKRRMFLICKRTGLDDGSIVSTGGLDACFDAVEADAKGKILLARMRLQAALATKCGGVALATAFPGDCAAVGDLTACLEEQIDCRLCRMFNGMDLLSRDCDAYDDEVRNGTCPE